MSVPSDLRTDPDLEYVVTFTNPALGEIRGSMKYSEIEEAKK